MVDHEYTVQPPWSFRDALALPVAGLFFLTSMPLFIAVLSWATDDPSRARQVPLAVMGTLCVALTGIPGIVLGILAKRSKRESTRKNGSLAFQLGLVTAGGMPILLFLLLWMLGWDLHLDLHIVG